MPTEQTDESKALAVRTELPVVTSAIEVSLGVRELTPEFATRRASLIEAANAYTKPPTTDDEQIELLKAQRALAALRTEVTKQAEALKSPLNAARSRIIEIHKTGIESIEKAEKHLQGLVNARQQRLAEERRKREAEAEQAAQKAREEAAAAERLRIAAEEAKRAGDTATAAELEEEAFERALVAETAAATTAVAPVSDAPMARDFKDFELIGLTPLQQQNSLFDLIADHPELFTVHISPEKPRSYSVTLRVRDLTDRLNGEPKPFERTPKGIRVVTRLTNLR